MSASRVYLQTGLADVRSFTEAFRASYPIGTRVYPDEAIALADFDGDLVDDIILGNRIFLSTQDRNLSSGSPVPPYGDFSKIEGLAVGNRKFQKVWAGNGAPCRLNPFRAVKLSTLCSIHSRRHPSRRPRGQV